LFGRNLFFHKANECNQNKRDAWHSIHFPTRILLIDLLSIWVRNNTQKFRWQSNNPQLYFSGKNPLNLLDNGVVRSQIPAGEWNQLFEFQIDSRKPNMCIRRTGLFVLNFENLKSSQSGFSLPMF
jgi:hypothetical protein